MFKSTKLIELGSCAFRQPRADSHCKYLHGYQLKAKFWFESESLDINHWVVDFGGLKDLKNTLQQQFDHTTCIAADDPEIDTFHRLHEIGVCDLRVMPKGTGIERISEWCFETANQFIKDKTQSRCWCTRVEVFEHDNNSAIFEQVNQPVVEHVKQLHLDLENNKQPEQAASAPEPVPADTPEAKKQIFSSNETKVTNSYLDKNAPKNSWRF